MLMGDLISVAQNPAVASSLSASAASPPITILTSGARIVLQPDTMKDGSDSSTYLLPPMVSRLRVWTHRAAKPIVVGSSGTRGVWIQRPAGIRSRLVAWTAARGDNSSVNGNNEENDSEQAPMRQDGQPEAEAESVTPELGMWPRSGAGMDAVMQGWNSLPRGCARKVDLHPVRVEDVKRIAFDDGTGRTCLGMRNGEVHVLDFA